MIALGYATRYMIPGTRRPMSAMIFLRLLHIVRDATRYCIYPNCIHDFSIVDSIISLRISVMIKVVQDVDSLENWRQARV